MKRRVCALMVLIGQLAFSGASPAHGQAVSAPGAAGPITPEPPPRASDVKADYRLGAGDKVRVTVYGEPNLTGEYYVSSRGTLSVPLIGDVPAAGQTVPQIAEAVRTKLADGYIRDPKVAAEVLTYRPYYILGEVNKPGEYPYTSDLTVMNAVATAGGFTYRAQTKKVLIRHAQSDKEIEAPLTATTPVEAGDTVRIKERFF
jgi:protein involved in polysaccharide export with SLBB domain